MLIYHHDDYHATFPVPCIASTSLLLSTVCAMRLSGELQFFCANNHCEFDFRRTHVFFRVLFDMAGVTQAAARHSRGEEYWRI